MFRVRWQGQAAIGDVVKMMIADEYLTSNIAAGLKTPKTARRSDRSRLRRVTLAEYANGMQARWRILTRQWWATC